MEDPSYPTLVGVIIVSGGLPLPSDWAGTRVATEDSPPAQEDLHS